MEVYTDYSLNGTSHDKSADAIYDEELLLRLRKIEQLPTDKRKLVKEFLSAFIFRSDLQKTISFLIQKPREGLCYYSTFGGVNFILDSRIGFL